MSFLDSVASALVNFVWQGAAIGLIAVAVQRYGRLSASGRYVTGVIAMGAMLAVPAVSVVRSSIVPADRAIASSPARPSSDAAAPASIPAVAPAAVSMPPRPFVPVVPPFATSVILVLWSAGVGVLSARLLGGWFVARGFSRRSAQPAPPEIQVLARRVAARLALDRLVGVFESTAVSVPVMIGWMRPVVLLPAAALSGLTPLQVEALIAHELAHVRRHDYLVNLLQSAVETLLFYHPAVWWVSKRMRIDRELCCDDLTLEVCDRVVYATALSDLAAMVTPPRMALAATDGPLVHRVRRILGQPVDRQDSAAGWLSACFVVLLAGSMAPAALTSDRNAEEPATSLAHQTAVAGGVQGGVSSGVAGGVAISANVLTPLSKGQTAPSRVPVEQQKAEAQARNENEYERLIADLKARILALEAALARQRSEYENAVVAAEKGTYPKEELGHLSAKIKAAEVEAAAKKADMAVENASIDLKQRELMVAREKETLYLQMEKAAARERVEEERAVLASRAMTLSGDDVIELTSPTETIQDGDVLVIAIKGEPDLPKTFVVRDRAIRFPFVGAVRVQGLTARQVREDLGKELAVRKMGGAGDVTVTVRRKK